MNNKPKQVPEDPEKIQTEQETVTGQAEITVSSAENGASEKTSEDSREEASAGNADTVTKAPADHTERETSAEKAETPEKNIGSKTSGENDGSGTSAVKDQSEEEDPEDYRKILAELEDDRPDQDCPVTLVTAEDKRRRKAAAERNKGKRILGKIGRTIGGTIVFLAVVYAAGTFYYMNHFYPHTTINGINVSNRSVAGIKHILTKGAESYQLTLKGKDGTEDTITTEQLGLYVEWEKEPIENLLLQQPGYDWVERIFDSRSLSVDVQMVKCEEDSAEKAIKNLSCMNPDGKTQSQNAEIVKDEANREFVIQDDVTGTIVDSEKILPAIMKAANTLSSTLDLEKEDLYLHADITSDSDIISEKLADLNNALGAQIIYDLGNDTYEVLDSDTFYDWLEIDSDLNISVDEDGVIPYVDAMADQYDDYGDGKYFNTCGGNRVYLWPSTYGWQIDRAEEVSTLISEILNGEQIERYPEYAHTANSHSYSCWGDSYIEVDITTQHMWCFKDGELVVSSDVVTGCKANGTTTDTGLFQIFGMYDDDVPLVGEDYVSYVNYFMAFYNGEGFHDASWRSDFGGSIYLTSGSHGCVNMPSSQAEALYNQISIGYPVIVYTDDMTEGPDEDTDSQ